jgi:sugar phosphate isomerase/epimerase
MRRLLSLAHLTALVLAPPELIRLAARTGFDRVGLRLLPAAAGGIAHRLMDDPATLRATKAAIAATGVGVFDLEIVRIGEGFDASAFEAFLAVGAELGAKAVLVAGDDPDEDRSTAHFAALCDVAAPYGLTCDLEFMPWTAVCDARGALRVVTAADRPNGGVLVDALHVARSRTTLEDVAALPRARLSYAQICDAPVAIPATVEGLIHDARRERLLPGEGGIDLAGLVARLPDDLPISCEVPNDARRAERGTEAWVKAVFEAAQEVVGRP